MGCRYDLILCRHAVDGLLLAMRLRYGRGGAQAEAAGGEPSPPVLVGFGGLGVAAAFGLQPPAAYLGLAGLLHVSPDALAVPVADADGRHARAVLPAPTPDDGGSLAELLDRLRERLGDCPRVPIVFPPEPLAEALPPLAPGDRVAPYFELRDLIEDATIDAYRRLGERIEEDGATLAAPKLYSRNRQVPARLQKRARAIADASGLDFHGRLLTLGNPAPAAAEALAPTSS